MKRPELPKSQLEFLKLQLANHQKNRTSCKAAEQPYFDELIRQTLAALTQLESQERQNS